ncbi:MAG: hypothetical protein FJ030_06560 [Chloroflexi bacterium]|nr:hypothetical protein [Chloroflexota bacterium]
MADDTEDDELLEEQEETQKGEAKPKKRDAANKDGNETFMPAPLTLEAAQAIARLLPIFATLVVMALSTLASVDPIIIGARAVVTLIVTGLFSWVFTYLYAHFFLWLMAKPKQAEAVTSTKSWEA